MEPDLMHPKIPKYSRLAALLRHQIQAGIFQPGDALPSLRHLMSEHKVTLVTVNKALDELRHEGWIESVQGCGTFVKQKSCRPVVGLVMPAHSDYPNPLVQIMIQAIHRAGWQPAHWPIQNSGDIATLHEQRFAGMFLLVSHEEEWELLEQDWPVVLLDSSGTDDSVVSVRSDHKQGAELVLEHLASQGHQRILYVPTLSGCAIQPPYVSQHRAAFEKQSALEVIEAPSPEFTAMKLYLGAPDHCTAIFCCHDVLVYKLLPQLKHEGYCVPRDMALVGYQNTPLAERIRPSLTSVDMQQSLIAERSIALMESLMSTSSSCEDIVIPTSLVIRASTPSPLCCPHFP